jgi:hypothetical protein
MSTLQAEQIALLSFANLLEAAHLAAPAGSDYERQRELVDFCRAAKKPFLASMPVRSHFECPICGVKRTQVELHFEDPRQPLLSPATEWMWSTPTGRYIDIDMSALHGILVHGEPIPSELSALLAGVGS